MEVLIKKQSLREQGFTVGITMNKLPTPGDVGIEIEVEGANLPKTEKMEPWVYHQDGSLRGEDNAEYVLRQPIKFEEVPGAIETLWALFAKKKSRLDDSNRTSVHVHLNCQPFHFNRLTSFMALYFCFEEILTEWAGDHRVGNLFCLRAKDAPAIVSQIRRFIKSDGRSEIRDNHHYAGLNANALHKFGSLEIRTLRGVSDPSVILDWVKIIQRLYRLSEDYKDPRDICAGFSGEGPTAFFNDILGDTAQIVRNGVNMSEDQIAESLYEGIRMAQDLCYCRDWSNFDATTVAQDPFGRRPKKSMAEALTQVAYMSAMSENSFITPTANTYQWAVSPPPTFNPPQHGEHDGGGSIYNAETGYWVDAEDFEG